MINGDVSIAKFLTALAVLTQASAATLEFLTGEALIGNLRDRLAAHPAVAETDGKFILEPSQAAAILTDLERDNVELYRQLHDTAVTHLTKQLQAGRKNLEPLFANVFERQANRLLQDDPDGLVQLVARVRELPLETAVIRQKILYFEGTTLLKKEQYNQALAAFANLLDQPDLDAHVHARTLNARAVCHRITGQPEKALTGYQNSLALWRQLGDQLYEGIVMMNMGIVAYELQQYAEAEDWLQQAANIFTAIGSLQWLATVQNELGLVHRDQGNWQAALTCFENYIARRKEEGAQDYVGLGLLNIGEVLLFQGRLEEAVATLQEALATMTTRVYRIDIYLHLGLAYQAMSNAKLAQETFQTALDLGLEIGRRDILPHVYFRLGESLHQQGKETAALANLEAAAQIIEATREPIHDEGLKISLLGRWQQVYEALILQNLALGRAADAFAWAERARARAFADAVTAGQGKEEPGRTATAAEIQAALPAHEAILCYFTTGILARDAPMLQAIPNANPLREYLLTPPRTLLFVITKDNLETHDCALDPNLFAVASPRGNDPARFLTPAVQERLFAALAAPAGAALSRRQLFIIPHGPLHHLPFNALFHRRLPESNVPTLVFAPSATVLLRHHLAAAPYARPGQSCLTVGYNGLQAGRALRYTEAEVTAVAQLLGGEAWIGEEMKKEKLRETAVQQRFLHMACHGWFNHQQPLESYLETGLGEKLTAQEIMETWRLQAELVVLSACQTGVSRILRSDEPMGLIRSFLYAGARAVMVSQWPVEDLPACLLMVCFYQELLGNGGGMAASLLRAQKWLRSLTAVQAQEALAALPTAVPPSETLNNLPDDGRPFAHPRHWAAFILVGGS